MLTFSRMFSLSISVLSLLFIFHSIHLILMAIENILLLSMNSRRQNCARHSHFVVSKSKSTFGVLTKKKFEFATMIIVAVLSYCRRAPQPRESSILSLLLCWPRLECMHLICMHCEAKKKRRRKLCFYVRNDRENCKHSTICVTGLPFYIAHHPLHSP